MLYDAMPTHYGSFTRGPAGGDDTSFAIIMSARIDSRFRYGSAATYTHLPLASAAMRKYPFAFDISIPRFFADKLLFSKTDAADFTLMLLPH